MRAVIPGRLTSRLRHEHPKHLPVETTRCASRHRRAKVARNTAIKRPVVDTRRACPVLLGRDPRTSRVWEAMTRHAGALRGREATFPIIGGAGYHLRDQGVDIALMGSVGKHSESAVGCWAGASRQDSRVRQRGWAPVAHRQAVRQYVERGHRAGRCGWLQEKSGRSDASRRESARNDRARDGSGDAHGTWSCARRSAYAQGRDWTGVLESRSRPTTWRQAEVRASTTFRR